MPEVSATLINLYHICHRELWLHANEIRMEKTSEVVEDGKLLHEVSYLERSGKYREITVGNSKIDFYDPKEKVVHEIKRSNKAESAHTAQVKYYIYLLEERGIFGVTGILEYPRLRLREEVLLTDADRSQIPLWQADIQRIISSERCPPVINKPFCKQCSYYELCYTEE